MSILDDDIDVQLSGVTIKPRVSIINPRAMVHVTKMPAPALKVVLVTCLSFIPIEEICEESISNTINKYFEKDRVRHFKFVYGKEKERITSNDNSYVYIYKATKYSTPTGFIIEFI